MMYSQDTTLCQCGDSLMALSFSLKTKLRGGHFVVPRFDNREVLSTKTFNASTEHKISPKASIEKRQRRRLQDVEMPILLQATPGVMVDGNFS